MATVTVPSELGLGDHEVKLREVLPSHDLAEAITRTIVSEICKDREIKQTKIIGERDIETLLNEAILNADLPKSIEVTFVPTNLEGFNPRDLPGVGIFIANLHQALFTGGSMLRTGNVTPVYTADGTQTHLGFFYSGDISSPSYCTNQEFFTSPTVILSGGDSDDELIESGRKLYDCIRDLFGSHHRDFLLPAQKATWDMERRVNKSAQVAALSEAQSRENIIAAIGRLPSILGRKFNDEKWGEVISVLLNAHLLQEPKANHPWRTGSVIVMDKLSGELYRVEPMYYKPGDGELTFNYIYRTVEVNNPGDNGKVIDRPWEEKGLLVLANKFREIITGINSSDLEKMFLSPETLLDAIKTLEKEYMDSIVLVVQEQLAKILASKRADLVRK